MFVCFKRVEGIVIKTLLSEICKVYVALQTCMLPGMSYMQSPLPDVFVTALDCEVHFASFCHNAVTDT